MAESGSELRSARVCVSFSLSLFLCHPTFSASACGFSLKSHQKREKKRSNPALTIIGSPYLGHLVWLLSHHIDSAIRGRL